MNTVLQMQNVSLTYHTLKNETQAVKDLSLEGYEGELLGIVGPSGCGKTTILSLLSGILSPTRGEVLICNQKANCQSNLTGYMLQRDELTEKMELRTVTGITQADFNAIYYFLQGAIYCWCKAKREEWFTVQDLLGGENFYWEGTPLIALYRKHKDTLGKDWETAVQDAGKDAGKNREDNRPEEVLYADSRRDLQQI